MCLLANKNWYCTSTASHSAKSLAEHYGFSSSDKTAIASFQPAINLQRNGFVPLLTAGGVAWLISLVLVTLVILAGMRAVRVLRLATKLFAHAAFVLMVVSAWGIGTATSAIKDENDYALDGLGMKRGDLLLALQWVAAVLVCLHTWVACQVADREGGKTAPVPSYYR